MRAWHDYHLTKHTVNGESREVAFQVSWPYDSPADIRRATITFSGVECYFLEHDLGSNIVYAFGEVPLHDFIKSNATSFDQSVKWGWPLFWGLGAEKRSALLHERHIRCFELSSSYGMRGWILAAEVVESEVRT